MIENKEALMAALENLMEVLHGMPDSMPSASMEVAMAEKPAVEVEVEGQDDEEKKRMKGKVC